MERSNIITWGIFAGVVFIVGLMIYITSLHNTEAKLEFDNLTIISLRLHEKAQICGPDSVKCTEFKTPAEVRAEIEPTLKCGWMNVNISDTITLAEVCSINDQLVLKSNINWTSASYSVAWGGEGKLISFCKNIICDQNVSESDKLYIDALVSKERR